MFCPFLSVVNLYIIWFTEYGFILCAYFFIIWRLTLLFACFRSGLVQMDSWCWVTAWLQKSLRVSMYLCSLINSGLSPLNHSRGGEKGSVDVEMGNYHCKWQIWWITWVLGVILWKELGKEQLFRIDQFLGTFLKSA